MAGSRILWHITANDIMAYGDARKRNRKQWADKQSFQTIDVLHPRSKVLRIDNIPRLC